MPTNRLVSFRCPPELLARLALVEAAAVRDIPSGPGATARAELDLWREVERHILSTLSVPLAWANCLAEVHNGIPGDGFFPSPAMIGVRMIATMTSAFKPAPFQPAGWFGAKWQLDEAELLRWLDGLSPVEDLVLHRAINAWWLAEWLTESLPQPTPEGWAAVGVVIDEEATSAFEERSPQ